MCFHLKTNNDRLEDGEAKGRTAISLYEALYETLEDKFVSQTMDFRTHKTANKHPRKKFMKSHKREDSKARTTWAADPHSFNADPDPAFSKISGSGF